MTTEQTSASSDNQAAERAQLDFQQAQQLAGRLHQHIGRVLLGQEKPLTAVLTGLLAGGHVLLEGVPGVGKTLLVRAIAQTIGGVSRRVQFTPDLMPADVTGHTVYDPENSRFRMRRGPVFTNLLLADEINRTPAKTQAALLEVMQEQQVTMEGKTLAVPQPFMVLATQNPSEHEGTYALPEAQLDRFLMRVKLPYPDLEQERAITRAATTDRVGDDIDVSNMPKLCEPSTVAALRYQVTQVTTDDSIIDYAARISETTRRHEALAAGAGPRASIALVRASRAQAMLAGRTFVTPDDVRTVAPQVLEHRLRLTAEQELQGESIAGVVQQLLNRVEPPRQ